MLMLFNSQMEKLLGDLYERKDDPTNKNRLSKINQFIT